MPELRIKIGSLELKNPVTVASGTFGFGLDLQPLYDPSILGAIFIKTLTIEPRQGNPPPRLVETPCGLINSIGLQNPGIEEFIKTIVPQLEEINTIVIASVAGESVSDFITLGQRLQQVPKISAIELNLSCPNIEAGGVIFGSTKEIINQAVSAVRKEVRLPLIVKLTPEVSNIAEMAVVAEEAGADAISLVNTFRAMAIDTETRQPILGNVTGGLSGPAIKPIAIRMVWEVALKVNIPVIGMGGIMSTNDALEFLIAGASAISIGTANFVSPLAPVEIIQGIEQYLAEHNINDINDLIGSVKGG